MPSWMQHALNKCIQPVTQRTMYMCLKAWTLGMLA